MVSMLTNKHLVRISNQDDEPMTNNQAENHYREKHEGHKQHHCSICGYKTGDPANFKRHKEIHGNPKYPCPLCGKLFSRKANMDRHTSKNSCKAMKEESERVGILQAEQQSHSDNMRGTESASDTIQRDSVGWVTLDDIQPVDYFNNCNTDVRSLADGIKGLLSLTGNGHLQRHEAQPQCKLQFEYGPTFEDIYEDQQAIYGDRQILGNLAEPAHRFQFVYEHRSSDPEAWIQSTCC